MGNYKSRSGFTHVGNRHVKRRQLKKYDINKDGGKYIRFYEKLCNISFTNPREGDKLVKIENHIKIPSKICIAKPKSKCNLTIKL